MSNADPKQVSIPYDTLRRDATLARTLAERSELLVDASEQIKELQNRIKEADKAKAELGKRMEELEQHNTELRDKVIELQEALKATGSELAASDKNSPPPPVGNETES